MKIIKNAVSEFVWTCIGLGVAQIILFVFYK